MRKFRRITKRPRPWWRCGNCGYLNSDYWSKCHGCGG